jgi:inorganic pyrophosphatase
MVDVIITVGKGTNTSYMISNNGFLVLREIYDEPLETNLAYIPNTTQRFMTDKNRPVICNVLCDANLTPGTMVTCRVIGAQLQTHNQGEETYLILAVPACCQFSDEHFAAIAQRMSSEKLASDQAAMEIIREAQKLCNTTCVEAPVTAALLQQDAKPPPG